MEALILDDKFQALCVVDAFDSFIWTERYNSPGDFELYMLVEKSPMEYLKRDYYVWRKETDRLMIIEDIQIDTDAENGSHVTVTGRSLESLLTHRVIADQTELTGNLQNGIKKLLDENVISPSDSGRRIPNLRFIENSDERVTALTVDAYLLGEDLLEAIENFCVLEDLGFKVTYNEEQSTFDFMLYFGEDRSYNQEKNTWVVFSPTYDNLLSSSYFESARNLRTAAIVAGDANFEYGQVIITVNDQPNLKGSDRREMFVDAGDIPTPSPEVDEDTIEEIRKRYAYIENVTEREEKIQAAIDDVYEQLLIEEMRIYATYLEERGREELAKTQIIESFEGEIEASRQYVYKRDFFIGDVVQIRDQYGKEAASRITEAVLSHDDTGERLTPTFTTLIGGDNKTET